MNINREEAKKKLKANFEVFIESLLDSLYPESDPVREYLKEYLSHPETAEKKHFVPSGVLLGFIKDEIGIELNSVSFGRTMTSLGFQSVDLYYKKKQRRGYYLEIKSNLVFMSYLQYEKRSIGQ